MGIGEWLGFGQEKKPDPEPTPVHRVPTREDLLAAVERVEQVARDGQVPGLVMSRLRRVTGIVRDTIPRMDRLGSGSVQAYNVMAMCTDYLPEAIGGYLRLPRQWADTRPVDRGKTSLMILVDQLDLLGHTMDKILDAINRADAEALVIHGRFLEEKFGHASSGGSLDVGSSYAVPPAPEGADGSGGPAPDIRLRPPGAV
ncbi:MAG TPA: hypothetical protein P5181_02875 [Dermatophilaceae bacterium]|nr:hypothetical protein [Dermatophilaceae bacterium]